jgi:hypothetical protein
MLIFTLKSILGQETSWEFLASGSLFATLRDRNNMNSLLTSLDHPHRHSSSSCDRPTRCPSSSIGHRLSPCDRPFSGSVFRPSDRSPLPQCKTLSLRRGSAKRSACLHPSQKSLSLARPSRKTMRYDLGFLWGLWLRVAVQNIIRNSPQRMPCGKRSCILYSPTQAAGATA